LTNVVFEFFDTNLVSDNMRASGVRQGRSWVIVKVKVNLYSLESVDAYAPPTLCVPATNFVSPHSEAVTSRKQVIVPTQRSTVLRAAVKSADVTKKHTAVPAPPPTLKSLWLRLESAPCSVI